MNISFCIAWIGSGKITKVTEVGAKAAYFDHLPTLIEMTAESFCPLAYALRPLGAASRRSWGEFAGVECHPKKTKTADPNIYWSNLLIWWATLSQGKPEISKVTPQAQIVGR
jgi:hypothetical protein